MKRFGALLLSALLTLALAGCGKEPLFTPLDGASAVSQEDSSLPEESSEIPESSLPESSEEPVADPYLGAPVPASDAVEETYFDDAIFVGDSLTYGLGAYQVLDAGRVVAHTGINPQTILTSACIEQPDGTAAAAVRCSRREATPATNVEERGAPMQSMAVRAAAPHKVYVMLGSNGVAFLSQSSIVEFYGEFLDQLREALPDAIFYVQSVLPVTHEKESGDSRYANSKIDALNEALLELATEKGVYYVNVAEAIKDENGCLPAEVSTDGMHFGVGTYRKWVEYLLTHTVDETKLP